MTPKPLRSVLYVPGSNERAIEKARSLLCDALIFDLEDAVALSDKEEARQRVCRIVSKRAVAGHGFGERVIAIRINDPQTKTGEDDLKSVLAACPDAVLVPKVKTSADVVLVSKMIEGFGGSKALNDLRIWAMMETPAAILNAAQIAELALSGVPRLSAFVMGTNDLTRETGTQPAFMAPWLMVCVLAARAYGLSIIDGVYNQFADEAGLQEQCQRARGQGMDGKSLIHPRQIDICNDVFSPTKQELQEAAELVAVFQEPQNQGASILQLHGRMVERLHYEMALKTLRIARMIQQK